MKTRDWLLEKFAEITREMHDLRRAYDEVKDALDDSESHRAALVSRIEAASFQSDKILELESRIMQMAPEKQFRIHVLGTVQTARIEAVSSCNGVTDITISLP